MVKRICNECKEIFHPYGPDDFICDSCIDGLSDSDHSICRFDVKSGISRKGRKICQDCLSDQEIDLLEQHQSSLANEEANNDSNGS